MSVMTGTAKVLRYAAFTLMTLLGLLGGLFVVGYAFTDLSIGTAIASTAAWLVPTLVLCVIAFRAPDRAAPWFVALTGVIAVLSILNASFDLVDEDALGPVTAIVVFALAVPLGFLGLHRSALSGLLLVLLGLTHLGAVALGFSGELVDGEGPRLANMLTGSGIVVVPLVVVGILFLVAGALTHDSLRFWHLPPTAHPAH